MKKHKLLEKAMRDYPKGTEYISAYCKIREISTGTFKIGVNNNVICVGVRIGKLIYGGSQNKWAKIVSKPNPVKEPAYIPDALTTQTPSDPSDQFLGKFIEVQNDFQRDNLLKFMESKGFKWAEGSEKAAEYIPGHNYPYAIKFEDYCGCIANGYRYMLFNTYPNFAKAVGLPVEQNEPKEVNVYCQFGVVTITEKDIYMTSGHTKLLFSCLDKINEAVNKFKAGK